MYKSVKETLVSTNLSVILSGSRQEAHVFFLRNLECTTFRLLNIHQQ
jgi:hypothetical protein